MNVRTHFLIFAGLLCAAAVLVPGCSQRMEATGADLTQFSTLDQLMEYAIQGNLRQLRAIIDANPDLVHARGMHQRTALHFAAAGGHKNVVQYLLEKGANPSALDEDGYTPADSARMMTYTDIAKLLMEAMK